MIKDDDKIIFQIIIKKTQFLWKLYFINQDKNLSYYFTFILIYSRFTSLFVGVIKLIKFFGV